LQAAVMKLSIGRALLASHDRGFEPAEGGG
jgi:hypothetical protein